MANSYYACFLVFLEAAKPIPYKVAMTLILLLFYIEVLCEQNIENIWI
jgi:hypothetical protein